VAKLCVVLLHSTDAPERAVAGVRAAHAAGAGGGLFLDAEGTRLGAKGVAETLSGADGRPDVSAWLAEIPRAGGRLWVSAPGWRERGFEDAALVEGAELVEPARLAALASDGWVFASY
jgi:predicted peroxiredoxin